MKTQQKLIEVYAHWVGLLQPTLLGTLTVTPSRGKEIFAFEYNPDWLRGSPTLTIDPAMRLYRGVQYAPAGQNNFGVFLDSSPDRWGRFLMDRRETQLAREEGRTARKLLESDYLLGVYDAHRIGGLRFRLNSTDTFLDNNKAYASPPWTSLRELEHASLELEKDHAEENKNYSRWLQMLIAPGGSLGGARPKASVVDEQQHLWIAKFPSAHDEINIGAWEMVAYRLAQRAKVVMSPAKVQKFNSEHHTFLSQRFDRTDHRERVHFASAMTLLQRTDGDDASQGASYLELAEFIIQYGAEPGRDLEQLWRRIVFSMCISNVDDHLRNHGFLFQPNGWVLSPAFDINPVATGNGLKLNVSQHDNAQDLALAREVAEYFRVKPATADGIIKEVVAAAREWRKEASALNISAREQNQMAGAFRLVE
jgi:serine/threonine-protein kinase HipA